MLNLKTSVLLKTSTMNSSVMNRVETEVNQWRSKEERFVKLFSFSLTNNKALLKEKLLYYNQIVAKYKATKDLDERFALRMLRHELKHIEKQLYPKVLPRLLRRFLIVPIKEQIVINQYNKKTKKNSQTLNAEVWRAGFNYPAGKIDEQIKEGRQQFSIPITYYINEKERLDHHLSFVKDQAGLYQFEGYKTILYDESKPGQKLQQYFSMREGNWVNVLESYNLLSGRSIQTNGIWIALDFNDKDAQGNFRLKEFHYGYGYDLEKALQRLPLKELLNKNETDKLLQELKTGNRVSVTFIKDGNEQSFYIEANPKSESVNIYDEHFKKITLNKAIGKETVDPTKLMYKVGEQQQQTQKEKASMKLV